MLILKADYFKRKEISRTVEQHCSIVTNSIEAGFPHFSSVVSNDS